MSFFLRDSFFHEVSGRLIVCDPSYDDVQSTIYKIVQPDSAQVKQIKPIIDWASQQIEVIEVSSNSQMSAVLDSVKVQLKPILMDEQQQRLIDFHAKAQGRWKGNEDRKR